MTSKEIQAIVEAALKAQAEAFAFAGAGNPKGKPAKAAKGSAAANEAECIKVFKKAGFEDIQPRVNVLTFNRWIAKGMRPKEGAKAFKVNNLRLFHIDQVRLLTQEELTGIAEKTAEEAAAKAKGSKPTLVS